MNGRRAIALLAAALVVASCGVAFPDNSGNCASKVAVNARLTVDDSDPRLIWATDLASGDTISLRVPGGYGAGRGAIFDPSGQAVARDGDRIVSGCRDYVQDAVMIRSEDVRPGPD